MPMFGKATWPTISHDEIVKRARILVIDDGEFAYKKLFERDDYTISQWSDVTDLRSLETNEWDVILLDLKGVGLAESADEGFGLLKHIRAASPAQIVVAYSNADLSLEYQPFFRDADAVLHKTKTDYVAFKRTVDELLDQRFSLGFYVSRINDELGEYAANAPKTADKARSAILARRTDALEKYLRKRVDDGRVVDRIIAVANVAVGILRLWTT